MAQTIEPLKTEVRTSWPVRLKGLEVNEKLAADIMYTSTVRQAISKLHGESLLKFGTAKVDNTIIVTRVA